MFMAADLYTLCALYCLNAAVTVSPHVYVVSYHFINTAKFHLNFLIFRFKKEAN